MIITATKEQIANSPTLISFAGIYEALGGENRDNGDGTVSFPFTPTGDDIVTHEQFASLINEGVVIDKPTFYIELPIEQWESEVPETFPESSYTVFNKETGEDEAKQMLWKDYASTAPHYSLDGTKIMAMCNEVAYGRKNGDGLSYSELVIWLAYFGFENIMAEKDAKSLLASSAYTEVAE